MTSVEFVEECLGHRLLEYQRELLCKLDENPPNTRLCLCMPPRVGYAACMELLANALAAVDTSRK